MFQLLLLIAVHLSSICPLLALSTPAADVNCDPFIPETISSIKTTRLSVSDLHLLMNRRGSRKQPHRSVSLLLSLLKTRDT